MSDLVINQTSWFSHAQAHIEFKVDDHVTNIFFPIQFSSFTAEKVVV